MGKELRRFRDDKLRKWRETKKDLKVAGRGEPGFEGCPKCKVVGKAVPTGKTHQGNRAYRCASCGVFFASKTTWAYCEIKGRIGKDLITNDCRGCKHTCATCMGQRMTGKLNPTKPCPHWISRDYIDRK